MKNLFLVVLATGVLNISFSQTTKGKVTYNATIIGMGDPDFPDYKVVSFEDPNEFEIKSGEDAVPINFHLFIDGKESLYKAEFDMEKTKNLGLLMNQTNLVGRHSYIYYTNSGTKEKKFQNEWVPNVLVNMDDINWKLTKETKKIGQYTAHKAVATISSEQTYGKKFLSPIIAWYTPEIEVPFGVQNFVGLPGLTLELTAHYVDGKIHYSAIDIDLDSNQKIHIEKPNGKQLLSEKEYVELIKSLNKKRKS